MSRRLTITLLVPICAFLLTLQACRRPAALQAPAKTPGAALAPFQSPSGKKYARTYAGPADDDEPIAEPRVAQAAAGTGDNYQGSARKAAKLSLVSAPLETFATLGALLDSLPSDDTMRALSISASADSDRVSQEQRSVVVSAYLIAASKESDNDFHCILGDDPTAPSRFMNAEVSGLPPAASAYLAQLTAARNEFKQFFTSGGNALPTSGYEKYDPPIPIRVSGSIFFDVDHLPGSVGPAGFKPKTSWEVHPISDIQFESSTVTQ